MKHTPDNIENHLKVADASFSFAEQIIDRFGKEDSLFILRLAKVSVYVALSDKFQLPKAKKPYDLVDEIVD